MPVTLEAVVFPALGQASPTGTVQFFVGGVALGNPVQLQSFVALLTTSQLQNGLSSITATYSGDSNFNGSNSTTSTIIVGNPDFQIGVNPGALTVARGRARERYFAVEPGLGTGLRRQCHDELFGAAGGRGVQFSAATSGP